jgi:hypothetical protein
MVLKRTAKKHGGVWHSIGVRGPEKGQFRFGGTDDIEFQERCGQGVRMIKNFKNGAGRECG